MSKNYYKNRLKKAIEQAAERLLHDSGQPKERYLYLTREQYESDPDGWGFKGRWYGWLSI